MKELQTSELLHQNVPLEQGQLKEMWEAAAKEFEKICGQSLKRGDIKSFEDVQKRIEKASYGPDAGPDDNWEKAKNVGLKALTCLKMLVNAVSQVSSLAPVPAFAANITGSALNFVFDIPQAIKGYNDAVDQVFTQISSALFQFQIYGSMENIDPALATQIHLVLTSFVKLCAHVVKYRQGGWGVRLRRQIKSIFDDDSGLAGEMQVFQRVLQHQRDVGGTLTLAAVLKTSTDTAILLQRSIVFEKTVEETQKGVQALKDDVDRIKTLTDIREALALYPRVRLDAKTTQTCTRIANRCLPGTGDWIWTHDAFKAWTSSAKDKNVHAPSSTHTLFLTGPRSSGKTSVAALITKHLERHREEERIYVAHYFFSPSTQKPDNSQTNVVLAAVKYMAFQIARVDPTVRKALAKALALDGKLDGGLEALWRELKIGAPGSGAVHYLVFDGIEYLSEQQAKTLLNFVFSTRLAGSSAGRVRVLLSGTNEKFDIHKAALVEGVLRVRVEDHNEPDMRIYVKHELEEHNMLQNSRQGSAQQQAYDKIVDKLPKNVKGSYSLLQFDVNAVLGLLNTRSTALELDKLLDQSMSSHEVAIKNLQRTLSTEEIRDLNELLKWVLFSNGPMRLDQLEAAMFLFSKKEPLTSLQHIIEHRYAAVFKVEESCVLAQDGVKEYLEKDRDVANPFPESSTISMTININNVSQELCAHFFWDLAHKSIRDKFKFDFDRDMSGGGGRGVIAVDELEAHYTIVQRAFHYLRNAPQEQTTEIGRYIVGYLPFHLQKIWELEGQGKTSTLSGEMRTEIGQNLYLLFRDDEIFMRHKESFIHTYWTADEMKGLQNWVKDSAVTRKLDARWRDAVQQAPTPVSGFMKELAIVLVKGLLRERSYNVDELYVCLWLRELVTVDAGDNMSNWEQVGSWCQKLLDLPDSALDSLWYERLAEASSCLDWWLRGDPQVARSLWKRAAEMKDPSWLCYRGLGLAYYNGNQLHEAITQMELALQKAGQEGAHPTPGAGAIIDLHLLLGTYMVESGAIQSAAEHYLRACESTDPEQARKGHLGHLKAQLSIADAKQRQEQLRAKIAAPGGETQLASIFKSAACDDDPLAFFSQLFTAVKSDPDLMQSIVQVLRAATQPQPLSGNLASYSSPEVQTMLLYERGVAAYRYGVVASEENTGDPVAEALSLWHSCRRISTDFNGFYTFLARREATAALATHYFQSVLDEERPECFSELVELATATDPGSQVYSANGDPISFMAILHRERYGEMDKARDALRPRLKFALQMLFDDIPDNDRYATGTLFQTLMQYNDLKNAGVALALVGPPDLVAGTLRFEGHEIVDEAEKLAVEYVQSEKSPEEDEATVYRRWVASREESLGETVKRLASETIQAAHIAVPDAAQQEERIAAAKAHIVQAQEVIATQKADDITVIAHGLLGNRLDLLQSKNLELSKWWGRCEGCAVDGTQCPNTCDWRHPGYNCMYCTCRDFCGGCLARLRNPDADSAKITVCSPGHKWLRYPPQGDKFYVGLRASRVRVPELRAVDGDERVFEFRYAEDSEETVSVEEWKEGLAKDWGIEI